MIQDLHVTVLSDNNISAPGLTSEHGLSMLVEADGHRLLFDAGQGKVLRANARTLGVSLRSLDAVVLSHGHYDHTGGLARVLPGAGEPRLFLHPAALEAKYERLDNPFPRPVGIPPASLEAVRSVTGRVVWTQGPTEIVPGIWCTGEIDRTVSENGESGRFYLDEACLEPDPLLDDQALFIETTRGIVVLAGCTHAGVTATLDQIARLTGQETVFAVVGGLHLINAPASAWYAAASALSYRDAQTIGPCHCTGPDACAHLAASFPNRYCETGAGSRITIQ
jgi:7,8-dihydropterin-6-yl-methyl-4-(beta-D-ribofuranosyl)aminobenzene 5'-phosphate synthase